MSFFFMLGIESIYGTATVLWAISQPSASGRQNGRLPVGGSGTTAVLGLN